MKTQRIVPIWTQDFRYDFPLKFKIKHARIGSWESKVVPRNSRAPRVNCYFTALCDRYNDPICIICKSKIHWDRSAVVFWHLEFFEVQCRLAWRASELYVVTAFCRWPCDCYLSFHPLSLHQTRAIYSKVTTETDHSINHPILGHSRSHHFELILQQQSIA